jgi:hypothetical protein
MAARTVGTVTYVLEEKSSVEVQSMFWSQTQKNILLSDFFHV